jgi:Fic family protein
MKLELPPKIKRFDIELFKIISGRDCYDFLEIIDARYLYWDEVKHRKDLPFEAKKTWGLIKANRHLNYKNLGVGKYVLNYYLTSHIQKELHEFDLKMIGGLYKNPITEFDKTEYLKNSLMEEAIASSQIEGAATTTKVAWEMLKTGRSPRNESEQMIFNNLRAIRFIEEKQEKKIDKTFIIELHRIMTVKTSAQYCAGDYRKEEIFVQDHVDGEIAHIPPDWKELETLMQDLFDFANGESEFIHPIVKASIIHFLIGFIHPFKDGNGRTARALFYWYLSKKGYTLIKNISISRAILESRIQYDKAFLKTENDENDLTYFISYSIKSLRVAFESLVRYRDKKKKENDQSSVISYRLIEKGLSKRQADLLGFLYIKENSFVSLQQYAKKHDIVRQTARRDLTDLVKMNLVQEEKRGKAIVFKITSKDDVNSYLNV